MPSKKKFLLLGLLLLISNIRLLQGMEEADDSSRTEETSRDSHTSLQHNSEQQEIAAAHRQRTASTVSPTLTVTDIEENQHREESINHEETKSENPSEAAFNALTIEDLATIWTQLQENDPDNVIPLTEPFLIFHEGEGLTFLRIYSLDNDSLAQNKALFRNISRILSEIHPSFNVSRFLEACFYREGITSQSLSEGKAPFNKLILKAVLETAARPDPGPHGFYDSAGMWRPWPSLPPAPLNGRDPFLPADISSRSFPHYPSIDSAQHSSLLETPTTDQEDNISNITSERFSLHQSSFEIPIVTIIHRQQLNAALKARFSDLKETSSSPTAAQEEPPRIANRENEIETSTPPPSSTQREKFLLPKKKRSRRTKAMKAVDISTSFEDPFRETITEVEKRDPLPSTISPSIDNQQEVSTPVATAAAVASADAALPLLSQLNPEEQLLRKLAKQARKQQRQKAKQDFDDREVVRKTLEEIITTVGKRSSLTSTISLPTPTVENHQSIAATSPRTEAEEEVPFLPTLLQHHSTEALKKPLSENPSDSSLKKTRTPRTKRKVGKKNKSAQGEKKFQPSIPKAITEDIAEDMTLERAGMEASANIVPDGVNPAAIYWKHYVEGTWNHPAFPRIFVKGIVLPPYIATMIAYHFVKGMTEPVGITLGVTKNIFHTAYKRQQALLTERKRVEALEQKRLHQESTAQLAEENRRNAVAAAVAERVAFRTNWERSRTERTGTDDELTSWQDAWERVKQARQQEQENVLVSGQQDATLLARTLERQQNRRFQLPRETATMVQYAFLSCLGYFIGTQLVHFFWDKYFGG